MICYRTYIFTCILLAMGLPGFGDVDVEAANGAEAVSLEPERKLV